MGLTLSNNFTVCILSVSYVLRNAIFSLTTWNVDDVKMVSSTRMRSVRSFSREWSSDTWEICCYLPYVFIHICIYHGNKPEKVRQRYFPNEFQWIIRYKWVMTFLCLLIHSCLVCKPRVNTIRMDIYKLHQFYLHICAPRYTVQNFERRLDYIRFELNRGRHCIQKTDINKKIVLFTILSIALSFALLSDLI